MSNSGKLTNKVAIITGGAGGFGTGIVRKFTTEGAKVVVVDINPAAITKVTEAYTPTQVIGIQADVATEEGWKRILDATIRSFGRLDVVINNAGVVNAACVSIDTPEAEYDQIMRVNLKSLYHSTKVVIPYFLEKEVKGLFINVSSISASRPRAGVVWYAASKAALTAASKGMALEWARNGIRFNVIQPVLGDTPMGDKLFTRGDTPLAREQAMQSIPLGRLVTPEDIGNTAAWLASDEATMLTGATIDVDGGRGV